MMHYKGCNFYVAAFFVYKEKIIDTLTAVTDFTEEEISKHYNEVLTK